jgi:hypothetical protein
VRLAIGGYRFHKGQTGPVGFAMAIAPGFGEARTSLGAVREWGQLVNNAKKATDLEISAASAFAKARGYTVFLRDPSTIDGVCTSDLLVARDGKQVAYDIYSPTTSNANRIIGEMAHKNKQAEGIILDLRRSQVTDESLGNVLKRVQNSGASRMKDIWVLR